LNTKAKARTTRIWFSNAALATATLAGLFFIFFLSALISGCASDKGATPAAGSSSGAGQSPDDVPPPGPEAKIHISYSHSNDFLNSLAVTKYSGAENLPALAAGGKDGASLIRFEGGIVVWQIELDKSFMSGVPVLGSEEKPEAVKEVKYGMLPKQFTESIPDAGAPEPLESGHYYVFAVTRASGSMSYEAVKVNGDGSLEAYEADPRAGTSYRLCCNLGLDFTVSASPPAESGTDQP
jgi:hypothetical protein